MVARRYEIYLRVFNHVLFCLFYKPTNNEVFDDFPTISEDCRRFPKIAEEDPKMLRVNIDKPWPIEHCNMANSVR